MKKQPTARERIKEDEEKGKSVKEMPSEAKHCTAGALICAGRNQLGMDLLEVHLENRKKQETSVKEKLKKEKEEYESAKEIADSLLEQKTPDEMKVSELRAIIKPHK